MKTSANAIAVLALKVGASGLQFLLLVLTARWFGVAFRGDIALFGATVNLIVLVVGFGAGASIVYLAGRDPGRAHLRRLLAVAYAFCVVVPVVLGLGAAGLGQSLGREAPRMVFVAVMQSLLIANVFVVMSGRAVWRAVLLEFLRPFSLVALAVAVAVTRGFRTPEEFYTVWCVAAALGFAASLPFVADHYRHLAPAGAAPAPSHGEVTRRLLGFGSLAQASNLVQFLNYRSLYFALERHSGMAALGLFSTAVSLAEVLWIPANSLAAVALNRVTRAGAEPDTRRFVLRTARLSLAATLAVAALAALVPTGWITALLGRDFAEARTLLVGLLPGMVVAGLGVIASAYNAGHGLYGRNLIAALAGLAVTGAGFALLVPRGGTAGAVLTMNASYLAINALLLAGLARRERVRPAELVPRADDLTRAGAELP